MLTDRTVLIAVTVVTAILLVLFTPRDRIREAQLVYLFKLLITWLVGLLVSEYGLIRYPVREFPNATANNFTYEYFIYPAISIVFVLRFPERKSVWHKIGWYLLFPSWMSALEWMIEKHTQLIDYVHWSWYWTWLSLLATFYLSRLYYVWFMKRGIPAKKP
ncbi:CBO0543 family protein [Cohnella candidum]|uniref:Uncharacterized protein n=1 Tax=Cohnella candidum TaxID=2674991 RepID=A0A3G3JVF0_9BACL|nr:CBO0543 family protein [Cohnella candidum]AYQ72154.1 hypothetical protein EAV92_05975 [Cohnella candidum]